MGYLGRVIFVGKTFDVRPFAAYFVTGRSPSSRSREVVDYPVGHVVTVEPLDKTQEQNEILHYPAILYDDDFVVVGNGTHTEEIFQSRDEKQLEKILDKWGVEPDGYTPRIAATISHSKMSLGMRTATNTKVLSISPELANAYGFATYDGRATSGKPQPFELSMHSLFREKSLYVKTPEELIRSILGSYINSDLYVGAAAIMRNSYGKGWVVHVENRAE